MLPETDCSPAGARTRLRGASRAALALALAASLLLPGRVGHAQTDEDKAAARALALSGADALKNGKFSEALDLVSRAEAIMHAPTHLLMIARAEVGVGRLVAAQETYLRLIHEELKEGAPPAFKNAQLAAKDELREIEPKIASLRLVLDGAGQKKVTIKMDDQIVSPALVGVYRPVDPGRHEIGLYTVGQSPVKTRVELKDGEKKELRLTVPDGPPLPGVPLDATDNPDAGKPGDGPPRDKGPGFFTPLRGAGVAATAVGAAGVAVGAVFMVKSGSSQSQEDTICGGPAPHPCPKGTEGKVNDLASQVASQKTIGVVGFAAGGVALAAGVTLIVLGKPKPRAAPATASVEPWFGGTSGGLSGRF